MLTERLIIIGRPRENAVAVAKRLRAKEQQPSLADNPGLVKTASWRKNALIFGYVNTEAPLALLREKVAGTGEADDLRRIEAILDLDHVDSVAFRAGVTETGVSADVAIQFEEGHQSLALNLTRTPPLSTRSIKCVPEGAVGVLAFALSSAEAKYDSGVGAKETVRQVTGLDFGREIFANIEEVAVFVMPPGSEGPGTTAPRIDDNYVPDGGIAITVKDPAQSDALWTQLLALPTLILGPSESSSEPTELEGVRTTVYKFPENTQIVYANQGNQILLGTSERAVALMARAKRESKSILTDKAFATATKDLGKETSKLLVVHAARACKLAAEYAPPEMAVPLKVMAPNAAKDLVVCAMTQESPTQVVYHAGIENLPQIHVILEHVQKLAAMAGHQHEHGHSHAELAEVAVETPVTPGADAPE